MNQVPQSRVLQGKIDRLKFDIEMQFVRGDDAKKTRAQIAQLRVALKEAKRTEPKPPTPSALAKSLTAKQREEVVTRHEAGRPTDGGGPSIKHWTEFMHHLIEDVSGVDVYQWNATKCDTFWRICLKG